MIIIKESNYNKPIEQICVKCSSVLGVEEKDIILYKEFDQREGTYYVDGFKCPCCNEEQRLKK